MTLSTLGLLLMLSGGVAPQEPQSGAYVVQQGQVEIARERFTFSNATLVDTIDIVARGLSLRTEMRLDSSGSPTIYRASVFSITGGESLQDLEVEFTDSTAQWSVRGAAGGQSGSTPVSRPYAMMQNPAFAHLAIALHRFNRGVRGVQKLNLWLPEGAVVVELEAEFEDSTKGVLRLSGMAMEFETEATGWLRHVDIPSQATVVEWHEALGVPELPLELEADTLPPESANEIGLEFQSGGLTLAGTLTLPSDASESVPVVVIIAGSGPTDRNGNSAAGIRTNMYSQLAWRLSEAGIASLRYDKRGVGESSAEFDMGVTTFDDFAADVIAAVDVLDSDGRFSQVLLLGHSEGAGLAIRAANDGAPVSGVALVAGIGRPFMTVLRGQLADQLDDGTMQQFDDAMGRYLNGEDPGKLPAALRPFLLPVNRRFTQTVAEYDPAAECARVTQPMIIVQGAMDFQVTVEDAEILSRARPDADLVVLDQANHVFKRVEDQSRATQTRAYTDPSLEVVPEFVKAIAVWVRSVVDGSA